MSTEIAKRQRGRPRSFDKEKALTIVLDLFRKKGFDHTSVEDIASALDLKKPSLYAAFGNKEQLFLDVLNAYVSGPTAYFQQVFDETTTKALVSKLLLQSIEVLFYFAKPSGCLVVMSTASHELERIGIQQKLIASLQQHQHKLAERFEAARKAGELKSSINADSLALYVVTIHKGLSLQAINGSTKAELTDLVQQVMDFWPTAS
ncbi:TetR/AcrR family transcriptional regulator [Methylophilus luteus]|uniref:TetR/AcrR family transcriptional regulator n=1 Tax=Methylophilus luteus TaxID=640108 RepID=A0ABW3F8V3_9PROT